MGYLSKYKLSDLYELSSGISSKPIQAGHRYPFCSFSTVFNNTILPDVLPDVMDTSVEERNSYSIKAGDVFLTRTSEVVEELGMSSVAIHDYPNATYSGFLKRLRPKTNLTYPKFMAAYFRSYYFRKTVTNKAVMTLRASFNEDIFNDIAVEIPSYEAQKAIGDLYFNLERKITLNQDICRKLEVLIKEIFDYWFIQYDFPDSNGKPYKSGGGELEWDEGIKTNKPKGWKVKTLRELAFFKNGINYEKNTDGDRKYKIINVRDISSSSLFMDEATFDDIILNASSASKYLLNRKAIIIARSGCPGAVRLIENVSDNVIFCGFIICCTPIVDDMRAYLAMNIKKWEGTSATKDGGSILSNVSQNTLGDLKVVVPPEDVIENFNDRVRNIIGSIQNCIEENRELIKIRDFVMPMLTSGQIRVD